LLRGNAEVLLGPSAQRCPENWTRYPPHHSDFLDPRRVMEIIFDVARIGESGLDYANPEKKYTVSAYPGESFSGLQLMCLMYAGFKRIAPDQDTGMDLNEPWLSALGLFNAKS